MEGERRDDQRVAGTEHVLFRTIGHPVGVETVRLHPTLDLSLPDAGIGERTGADGLRAAHLHENVVVAIEVHRYRGPGRADERDEVVPDGSVAPRAQRELEPGSSTTKQRLVLRQNREGAQHDPAAVRRDVPDGVAGRLIDDDALAAGEDERKITDVVLDLLWRDTAGGIRERVERDEWLVDEFVPDDVRGVDPDRCHFRTTSAAPSNSARNARTSASRTSSATSGRVSWSRAAMATGSSSRSSASHTAVPVGLSVISSVPSAATSMARPSRTSLKTPSARRYPIGGMLPTRAGAQAKYGWAH
jgi:hypothetical protein